MPKDKPESKPEDKRMYFIRNFDSPSTDQTREFEVIVDSPVVGECSFGPYSLMLWECRLDNGEIN